MPNHLMRKFERSAVCLMLFSIGLASRAAGANRYTQHNLVSDIPGIADQTDPNLVNPWGISMSSTSPFWISNNHAGVAAVYNGQGQLTPAASPLRSSAHPSRRREHRVGLCQQRWQDRRILPGIVANSVTTSGKRSSATL